MEFNSNLCGCSPAQIININMAFNNLQNIEIYNNCDEPYDLETLEYSYSVDMVCWSCYMDYNTFLSNIIDLKTDVYIRVKVQGVISKIMLDGEQFFNYSTQLDTEFTFNDNCSASASNPNMYNPYANMDCAIKYVQQLSETVGCMFGIPIYYFKLNPNENSKDITFKEYTLMDVEPPKQIKLVVRDGMMPSSKPEFGDFGLDWQTDWETEITKGMFATAFGPTAQPMEGDFIWIPMMKRMWTVSGAYEEKKDAFMWNATTFTVSLVKYEEKGSVDLGDMTDMVNSFVKNKYEDLFGDDNEDTLGSGEETLNPPSTPFSKEYPIYESDALRKYVSCDALDIKDLSTYYKGTLVSDSCYSFTQQVNKYISYQKKVCGIDMTLSFIIQPLIGHDKGKVMSIGKFEVLITYRGDKVLLHLNKEKKARIELDAGHMYFVFIRWSKQLNILEMGAAPYTYDQSIPRYKLQDQHYYYDIDRRIKYVGKYNIELSIDEKAEVRTYGILGTITNIKVFTSYNDNISEILQMLPTNSTLMINDTARKIVGLDGLKIR